MEAARLREQVHASVAQQKKKEENKVKGDGASSSAQKAVKKGHLRENPTERMIVHLRSLLLSLGTDP